MQDYMKKMEKNLYGKTLDEVKADLSKQPNPQEILKHIEYLTEKSQELLQDNKQVAAGQTMSQMIYWNKMVQLELKFMGVS